MVSGMLVRSSPMLCLKMPVTQTSSIQKNLTLVVASVMAAAVPGLVMKSQPVQSVG